MNEFSTLLRGMVHAKSSTVRRAGTPTRKLMIAMPIIEPAANTVM
ncbi:MAG TPA: hypothetical protein VFU28_19655 [Vicinamibacterales bacterium]|nr:hypothetical protein [Vicinamibacterales bacterium]